VYIYTYWGQYGEDCRTKKNKKKKEQQSMPRKMEIFSRAILGTRAIGSSAPVCTNQKGAQNTKNDQTGDTNTEVATQ
jgi:hypothetical protein